MREVEGIVEIEGSNAVWMDPVAVLSSSYSAYEVCSSQYYSRSSADCQHISTAVAANEVNEKGSRKRKRKKAYSPNEKEQLAQLRHQDSRSAILNAHASFLATTYPSILSRESFNGCRSTHHREFRDEESLTDKGSPECQLDFLQLAKIWQAPLYELNILNRPSEVITGDVGSDGTDPEKSISNIHRLFNAFIKHDGEEAIAECAGASFLLPQKCQFLISDVSRVHRLIPAKNEDSLTSGYNLIVIDPPWENKSVHRKSVYPTIPNRQLLSLPVKQLSHKEGALVGLWLTNREKLHQFVEKELFPAWGVRSLATWYWLKLNNSGEMISSLDLQHHKPYECLLLGYVQSKCEEASSFDQTEEAVQSKTPTNIGQPAPPDKFVVMSIPGDHSRKPPMGNLLAKYAPGPRHIKGLELFARELNAGWTSWGNEPLHFQNLKYFKSQQLGL